MAENENLVSKLGNPRACWLDLWRAEGGYLDTYFEFGDGGRTPPLSLLEDRGRMPPVRLFSDRGGMGPSGRRVNT